MVPCSAVRAIAQSRGSFRLSSHSCDVSSSRSGKQRAFHSTSNDKKAHATAIASQDGRDQNKSLRRTSTSPPTIWTFPKKQALERYSVTSCTRCSLSHSTDLPRDHCGGTGPSPCFTTSFHKRNTKHNIIFQFNHCSEKKT